MTKSYVAMWLFISPRYNYNIIKVSSSPNFKAYMLNSLPCKAKNLRPRIAKLKAKRLKAFPLYIVPVNHASLPFVFKG